MEDRLYILDRFKKMEEAINYIKLRTNSIKVGSKKDLN